MLGASVLRPSEGKSNEFSASTGMVHVSLVKTDGDEIRVIWRCSDHDWAAGVVEPLVLAFTLTIDKVSVTARITLMNPTVGFKSLDSAVGDLLFQNAPKCLVTLDGDSLSDGRPTPPPNPMLNRRWTLHRSASGSRLR